MHVEYIETEAVEQTRPQPKWKFLSTLKVGHSVFTTAPRNNINSARTNRRPKVFSVYASELNGQKGYVITRTK